MCLLTVPSLDKNLKFSGPQRVRNFLWLVGRKRVLNNDERVKKGFDGVYGLCPLWGLQRELDPFLS